MGGSVPKISVVGLLLWGLLHAWFGHDLFHGHHHSHHEGPGQAAHTTAISRADSVGPVTSLVPVAILLAICSVVLPQPQEMKEAVTYEVVGFIEAQFLERPQSQRAPPHRFSFA